MKRVSFRDPEVTDRYTLSLHDALPISTSKASASSPRFPRFSGWWRAIVTPAPIELPIVQPTNRSEEHTSELQSRSDLVCRLLLEKKKNMKRAYSHEIHILLLQPLLQHN